MSRVYGKRVARRGWISTVPEGRDESDGVGRVMMCGGEVDDVNCRAG